MKDYIPADRIANRIRMLRTDDAAKSFLIVEGDTDKRVWDNLVAETKCCVEVAFNKNNAIAVLKNLEKYSFAGVLAIVDADFWRLQGTEPHSPNLLLTDSHDLETMLLQSPALEKLLGEHGSKDKIEKLTKSCGKTIRNLLLDAALPIGYLRWHSQQPKGLNLKFQGLKFKRFIDEKTLALDNLKLINEVKEKYDEEKLDNAVLIKHIDGLKSDSHDPWSVCCGHDLMSILSVGLCKALGSRKANEVARELLERNLRLAYEASFFRDTQLYQEIQNWEKANEPFQVMDG
ncbi:MAG: DUF4435 domain-containing protein [Oscillatoria sp. SIO1A7]|nr:DUF4435 domain-containing protein [Oscillatoria sp. SIO1A7]